MTKNKSTLTWTCPDCKEHGIVSSQGSTTNTADAGELAWDDHVKTSPTCRGKIKIRRKKVKK